MRQSKKEIHSCIYFACHASQNSGEPLKSSFILHEGALEFSTILKKHLVGANFAYVKQVQAMKFSEEAVHLAAGMLATGCRGVVAMMLSISDVYGPRIAKDFYAITHGTKGSSALSSDDAARVRFIMLLRSCERSSTTWCCLYLIGFPMFITAMSSLFHCNNA